MLYHLFDWLTKNGIKFPGSGLFQFITFRVLLAVLLSLVIATVFGRRIINFLRKKQIGETVRDLGLKGEKQKSRYTYNGWYYYHTCHTGAYIIISEP